MRRALEGGAHPPQHREAGAGDLGGALEVEDAERRPQVPVRLGLEVEATRLAPGPLDAVRGLVRTHRHRRVGEVGDDQLEGRHLASQAGRLRLELGDACPQRRHAALGRLGLVPASGREELPDLLGAAVALGLETLDLRLGLPPAGVHLQQALQGRIAMPVGQGLPDTFGGVAVQLSGQHADLQMSDCSLLGRRSQPVRILHACWDVSAVQRVPRWSPSRPSAESWPPPASSPPARLSPPPLSLASVFLPAAWLAPAGFRRRAADLAILPAAFALTLLGDPAQRAMALPPLLVLAALAAVLSARHRASPRAVLRLAACFALAVALAGSLGLVGFPAWRVALALLVPPLLTAGACLLLGWDAALVLALLVAPLPWVRWPLAASLVLALAAALAGFFLLLHTRGRESRVQSRQSHPHPGSWSLTLSTLDSQLSTSRVARGWLPGALGFALVASALAPWGLLAPHLAFPHASWLAAPLVLAALVLSPLLPPAAAGAAWLAVALTLGPPQPPPAERPGLSLSAASPSAQLPPGSGAPYVLDLALANAGSLPAGSLVATLRIGSLERPLHAGAALAEWALRRPGTRPAHGLPDHPVFRAREVGATGFWSVGNRLLLEVPTDVTPSLTRSASLPDKVLVTVSQAGPARPTPPRDWPLPAWLLAAALAVAALQLAARSFDSPGAFLPWALLVAGAARRPPPRRAPPPPRRAPRRRSRPRRPPRRLVPPRPPLPPLPPLPRRRRPPPPTRPRHTAPRKPDGGRQLPASPRAVAGAGRRLRPRQQLRPRALPEPAHLPALPGGLPALAGAGGAAGTGVRRGGAGGRSGCCSPWPGPVSWRCWRDARGSSGCRRGARGGSVWRCCCRIP